MLTRKQSEYIRCAYHRWNVKTGATRSGKTWLDIAYVIPKRLLDVRGKPFGAAVVGCVQALAWLTGCGENVDVCVNFDDSIIEDTNATIDRNIKLVDAGLCSKRDAIMNIYKLCEADAERKMEEINAESRVTQGAIEDFFLKPEQ